MSKTDAGRRKFMVAMGVGGAAAAAALTTQSGQAKKGVPENKTKGKGYHLTDHIREYYRTTRV